MRVKRTKDDKFVFDLSYEDRNQIFRELVEYISTSQSRPNGTTKTESQIMKLMYESILHEMLWRKNFCIDRIIDKRLTFSAPEAIALMWLLRNHDKISMIQLKGEIHKQLL